MNTNTETFEDRVFTAIGKSWIRDTDFGSYDFGWLDSPEDVAKVAEQLQWLREAVEECKAEGDAAGAEANTELLRIIWKELADKNA